MPRLGRFISQKLIEEFGSCAHQLLSSLPAAVPIVENSQIAHLPLTKKISGGILLKRRERSEDGG